MKCVAMVMVALVLVLTGCASKNAEQFEQTLALSRTALEAAKAGNVAGTLDIHLGGRLGAGVDTLWYVGNAENVIDANLQFRFSEPQSVVQKEQ